MDLLNLLLLYYFYSLYENAIEMFRPKSKCSFLYLKFGYFQFDESYKWNKKFEIKMSTCTNIHKLDIKYFYDSFKLYP